jgi:hypothetical protein
VPRGPNSFQRRRADLERSLVLESRERVGDRRVHWHVEGCAHQLGQPPGAGEVVGVDVGVEHVVYPPATSFGQPEVHLSFQGGVYD